MADKKRIHVSPAESLVLPSLALYHGVDRADKLQALNNPNLRESARRVGRLIIGEPVLEVKEEERHLADKYLNWAKAIHAEKS